MRDMDENEIEACPACDSPHPIRGMSGNVRCMEPECLVFDQWISLTHWNSAARYAKHRRAPALGDQREPGEASEPEQSPSKIPAQAPDLEGLLSRIREYGVTGCAWHAFKAPTGTK